MRASWGALALTVAAAWLPAAPTARAASPFAWRGVVEGPYGRPWDHPQRMRVLAFMTREGWNAYVHAPKDDLYQRTQWRDPYPAQQQSEFDDEIAYARRRGVAWIPNLSPGLPLIPTPRAPEGAPSQDVCYSCPEDVGAITGKFEPFWRAGARTFMLSFDDVQKVLTHPQDLAAYGGGDQGYGRANGDLLTRVSRALRARDPAARLIAVGADYNGTTDTAYLQGLRELLEPQVELMWTGPGTFSVNFTREQVRAYARAIGRKPIVWDNWTVNDADGNIFGATRRIHLGPYLRKPELVGEVRGFLLNPMNEADLNLLPFATAADYFRRPRSYNPRRSFLTAVAALGGRQRQFLRAFAEVNYSSHFDLADDAPTFAGATSDLLQAYEGNGQWPAPRDRLTSELDLLQTAAGQLDGVRGLGPFVSQARPFLASAATGAAAARVASGLLAAERPLLAVHQTRRGFAGRAAPPDPAGAGELRTRLVDRDRAVRADQHDTFGYRFVFDTPPPPVPPNKLDDFLSRVRSLDLDWQPRASQAASGVAVDLEGRPVAVEGDGSFALGREASGRLLRAVDGAGGRSVVRVVPCGAPRSTISRRTRLGRHRVSLRGRARGAACRVRRVRLSVARRLGHGRCRFLRRRGLLGGPRRCDRPVYLRARGATSWRYRHRVRLRRGRYLVKARALDSLGHAERRRTRSNTRRLRVR